MLQTEQKFRLSKLGSGAHEELIPLRQGTILAQSQYRGAGELSWCDREKALLE
jgi:hypothetical protein